jgi:hypothetical protein
MGWREPYRCSLLRSNFEKWSGLVVFWSRGSLCAAKIVHDCMASLSPVGIVSTSLFHHHCQPKLHDIVCMVIFSCSRRNYRVKWNTIVIRMYFPWNLRMKFACFKKISCYVLLPYPQYVMQCWYKFLLLEIRVFHGFFTYTYINHQRWVFLNQAWKTRKGLLENHWRFLVKRVLQKTLKRFFTARVFHSCEKSLVFLNKSLGVW